ncbi:MAG: hypothetical protein SWC96_12130 [Thermodesulfobacteriota bacterium]|nr:hypothetical protein [Thermodesulfobacteriota bacterium]
MSYPDRNNPYTFNPYVEWREKVDYYQADPFVRKMVRGSAKELERYWKRPTCLTWMKRP